MHVSTGRDICSTLAERKHRRTPGRGEASAMKTGHRGLTGVLSALGQRRHYVAARNMLTVYRHPIDGFRRYLFGRGKYPVRLALNTPEGSSLPLTVYSYDDILTVNEVFCRLDYPAVALDEIIVDFGSNIGISAAYFLTHAPNSFLHLYEPLPWNIERLRRNLSGFEGRYAIHQCAVGESDGEAQFGWESTGRYGGIGLRTGNYLSVTCQDSNQILEDIIARYGRIDILKIDIETLERQVTERIPVWIARNIGRVYVECMFPSNPLERTHTHRRYGNVSQFVNKKFRGWPHLDHTISAVTPLTLRTSFIADNDATRKGIEDVAGDHVIARSGS